jgi:serine/threonine protein kinase
MDNYDGQAFPQPRVGDVIAGKYRLDRVVGAGGMGMVFAATHMELDRLVAVKFVHSTYCQNPEVIARFVREARAVVRIESEHVAKVIDVGHAEGGTPYMVMEYLDGEDLSSLLRLGPLSIPDAVDYVVQASAAMQEAHEMGIVHRDLKPANLFLTHRRDRTPLIKVLDFGISKLNDPEPTQAALTNPAMLMGSPAYMSPEQLTNPREVDPRTDLWSLGVILFELLAGRPAFQAGSLPLLMTAIMQQAPDDLIQLRPDVPPALAQVVARCLEKSADDRFQTVSELVAALLPFAPRRSHWSIERIAKSVANGGMRGETLAQGSVTLGSVISTTGPLPPVSKDGTRGEWSRESDPAPGKGRPRWLVPVALTAIVGVLGAVGWFVLGAQSEPVVDSNVAASSGPSVVAAPSVAEVPSVATADVVPGATVQPATGDVVEPAVSSAAPEITPPPRNPPRPSVVRPAPRAPAPRQEPPSGSSPRNPLQMDLK